MRFHVSAIHLVVVIVLAVAGGCSTDDSPTSNGGNGRTVKADPSFATDIQEIFGRRGCTRPECHGTTKQAGLYLTADSSFANLVGVLATSENYLRVETGNADSSYIIIKLEGRQKVGAQMPFNGLPLDSVDLQNIRNWIDNGAQEN